MPKPKANTVGSYERHGELMTMRIEYKHPADDPTKRLMRWTCSCGARGSWLLEGPYRKASLALLWNEHVRRQHSDYDL